MTSSRIPGPCVPEQSAALEEALRDAGLAVRNGLVRTHPGASNPIPVGVLHDNGVTPETVRACRAEIVRYTGLFSYLAQVRPKTEKVTEGAGARALCLTFRAVANKKLTAKQVEWLAQIGWTPGGFSTMSWHLGGIDRMYSHAGSIRRARAASGFASVAQVLPALSDPQGWPHATAVLPGFPWAPPVLHLSTDLHYLDLPGVLLDQSGRYWTAWARQDLGERTVVLNDTLDNQRFAKTGVIPDDYLLAGITALEASDRKTDRSRFRVWHARNAAALNVTALVPAWVPPGIAGSRFRERADAEGLVVLGLLDAMQTWPFPVLLPYLQAGLTPQEATVLLALPAGHPDRPNQTDLAVMTALIRNG